MKERHASEYRSWMWQPQLPGGAIQFPGGTCTCWKGGDLSPTDHSPNLTLNANKRPSWNPNQQAARYTERMFMPRPELIVVAGFEVPANSVLSR
jgi:hypothetical protein